MGLLGQRQADHHEVAAGEDGEELQGRDDLIGHIVAALQRLPRAANAQDAHVEGFGQAGDLLAHVPHPYYGHGAAFQLPRRDARPFAPRLRPEETRPALGQHHHHPHRVFAHRRSVNAAGGGDSDAALQHLAVQEAVGAGAGELDPAQVGSQRWEVGGHEREGEQHLGLGQGRV